jgi:hypothetical protein
MNCLNAIIHPERIASDGSDSSSDPVSKLYSEQSNRPVLQALLGDESFTASMNKPESAAPSLETKGNSYPVSLSDRLTVSLITAGLVKGIIPTSMRRRSGQQILDSVLLPLDGGEADEQREDF